MTKNYPDQLAEWVKQRERKKHEATHVEFLAVRHDIKAGFDAGYSAKTIWENLRESNRISFCYETFRKYARTLFPDSKNPLRRGRPLPQASPYGKPFSAKGLAPPSPEGFTFNADPKKEELL